MQTDSRYVSSGVPELDQLIDGFRLGDNVVWQVDALGGYGIFAQAFMDQARRDQRTCVYIRFGDHPPVLKPHAQITVESFDPRAGFDVFSGRVHDIITRWGKGAFYVFDRLSCLTDWWATDELLASFFQATCPYLYELDTVAFFALERQRHAETAVTRIRDTTQVLLDHFYCESIPHVWPLKVWQRHSTRMFRPHRIDRKDWIPVPQELLPPARLVEETTAPWDTVYEELQQWLAGHGGEAQPQRIADLRESMERMLFGLEAPILAMARQHLSYAALMQIRERVAGSGRIGGKATGMLLARAMVRDVGRDEAAVSPVDNTDAFHIGSDVFYSFLVRNQLFRARLAATRSGQLSREMYALLEERFLQGTFDEAMVRSLRGWLEEMGEGPIIVRSSSLLEDSFGNAFAGKYDSEFCVNQGPLEDRLKEFMQAVKRVYASTLNPDALRYRQNRGMLEKDEQMAILVQRVAGQAHGRYFLPTLAGVAFSRNLYAWTDRIDPRQGVIRLVFGLGTRAVNRVGRDYPRLISVSHPELRPEIGKELAIYSQRFVDVLDLQGRRFDTVPLSEVSREGRYPSWHWLVSIWQEGHVADPVGVHVDPQAEVILTFNRLMKESPLVRVLGRILQALEKAYGHPVDTEFAAEIQPDGRVSINLLQCRPMWMPGSTGRVALPAQLSPAHLLFRANRFMNGGISPPIRFILYVDAAAYAAIEDDGLRKALPRVVGQINQSALTRAGRIMMMGPGRWGSRNPDLGIGVGYADIDQVAVLVEVAREAGGHVPEVSYGTHFFQDLVEAEILYVPVYPEQPETAFNEAFFQHTPNALAKYFPGLAAYAHVVRLIDVPAVSAGRHVRLAADPESRQAVCYLAEAQKE